MGTAGQLAGAAKIISVRGAADRPGEQRGDLLLGRVGLDRGGRIALGGASLTLGVAKIGGKGVGLRRAGGKPLALCEGRQAVEDQRSIRAEPSNDLANVAGLFRRQVWSGTRVHWRVSGTIFICATEGRAPIGRTFRS